MTRNEMYEAGIANMAIASRLQQVQAPRRTAAARCSAWLATLFSEESLLLRYG